MMEEMFSPEGLSSAIEAYCTVHADTEAADYGKHLNVILVQVQRGDTLNYSKLVTQHLGSYLVHHDSNIRMRATLLLAEVLHRLPQLPLNGKKATSLLVFFADRIESDYDSALPCFFALKTLLTTRSELLEPGVVAKVTHTLLGTNHVPSMAQSFRFGVFELVVILLERFLDVVQSLDLVSSFTNAMDGEKDPRCLMQCLRVCEIILSKFPAPIVAKSVQPIFEVTTVYFPITFRPPPNDPYGITTQDLVEALTNVFKATPLMVEHVVPMVLDKLRLTKQEVALAKVDSLKLLIACLPCYNVQHILSYLEPLHAAVYQHVVNAEEAQIGDAAVAVATVAAKEMSKCYDIGDYETPLATGGWSLFVEQLLDKCEAQIRESVDSMLSRGSGRILEAVASSSALGLRRCAQRFVPILITWCDKQSNLTQRNAALVMLVSILKGINADVDYPLQLNPLQQCRGSVYTFLCQEVQRKTTPDEETEKTGANSARVVAVQGLDLLLSRAPTTVLTDDEVRSTVELMSEGISDAAIRRSCLEALGRVGGKNDLARSTISSTAVPLLLSLMERPNEDVSWVLDAIVVLCNIPDMFDRLVPGLLGFAVGSDLKLKDSAQLLQILSALDSIVKRNIENKKVMKSCLVSEGTAPPLVPSLLAALLNTSTLSNGSIPSLVSSTLRTACQNGNEEEQDTVARLVMEMLLKNMENFDVLVRLLPAAAAVLGSLKDMEKCTSCEETFPRWQCVVCSSLIKVVLRHGDRLGDDAITSAAQVVASILNKTKDIGQMKQVVFVDAATEGGLSGLISTCTTESGSIEIRVRALTLLTWSFKALAMRGQTGDQDSFTPKYLIDVFIKLLESESAPIRRIAAQAFGTCVMPCEQVLNKSCFARESFLFKQKFFRDCFGALKSTLMELEQGSREDCLFAIAYLTQYVPQSIVMSQVDEILGILVQALAASDVTIQVSALHSIARLTEEDINCTVPHLPTLIPRLLELTHFCAGSKAKDRVLALHCLEAFSKLPYHKVHPFRSKVSHELLVPLDDRKRVVRKTAVECRNLWLTLVAKV